MQLTNLTAAGVYFILIAVIIFTILIAFIKDRHKPATKHLIRLCIISAGWQICAALFFLVSSEATALWLYSFKLVFSAFSGWQLLLLSVRFYRTESSRSITMLFGFLCIIPVITSVLAITSPLHTLIREELYIIQNVPIRLVHNVRGFWFYVNSFYSYILAAAAIVVVIFQHVKLPKGFRAPSTLVVIGSCVALLGSFIVVLTPYSGRIDLTLVGLSIGTITLYIGITISDASSLIVLAMDSIFSYIKDSIIILDRNRNIIEMNKTARDWLQKLDISAKNMSFDDLIERLASNNKDALREGDDGERDFYLMVDRQITIYNLNERPIVDPSGRVSGGFAVFSDVTRYQLIINHLEQVSGIDPLTALGNRRGYEQALDSIDIPDNLPLSVILGDVNGLKHINDTRGHEAGDTMLRTVAQVLCDSCPEDSRAYRIGGDEFVILMPRTEQAAAEDAMDRIRALLSGAGDNSSFGVTIALGYTTKETEEQDIRECIAIADDNMYKNKQNDRRGRALP